MNWIDEEEEEEVEGFSFSWKVGFSWKLEEEKEKRKKSMGQTVQLPQKGRVQEGDESPQSERSRESSIELELKKKPTNKKIPTIVKPLMLEIYKRKALEKDKKKPPTPPGRRI